MPTKSYKNIKMPPDQKEHMYDNIEITEQTFDKIGGTAYGKSKKSSMYAGCGGERV